MSDKRGDRGAGGYLAIIVGCVMLAVGLFGSSILATQSAATRPMIFIFGPLAIAWGLWENMRAEKKVEKSKY